MHKKPFVLKLKFCDWPYLEQLHFSKITDIHIDGFFFRGGGEKDTAGNF